MTIRINLLINKSGWDQYLEVKPEQVRGTVAALSMISHSAFVTS